MRQMCFSLLVEHFSFLYVPLGLAVEMKLTWPITYS